jgi:hypothetical protein
MIKSDSKKLAGFVSAVTPFNISIVMLSITEALCKANC